MRKLPNPTPTSPSLPVPIVLIGHSYLFVNSNVCGYQSRICSYDNDFMRLKRKWRCEGTKNFIWFWVVTITVKQRTHVKLSMLDPRSLPSASDWRKLFSTFKLNYLDKWEDFWENVTHGPSNVHGAEKAVNTRDAKKRDAKEVDVDMRHHSLLIHQFFHHRPPWQNMTNFVLRPIIVREIILGRKCLMLFDQSL